MKKLVLLIVIICSFLLLSCSPKIPSGMAQETYDVGVKALEIMDKYNNADINADEADQRLDALYAKLDALELSDEAESEYGLSADTYNLHVQISISYFQYQLSSGGDTYSVADDLRESLELN